LQRKKLSTYVEMTSEDGIKNEGGGLTSETQKRNGVVAIRANRL